jgi:protein SCO1/2
MFTARLTVIPVVCVMVGVLASSGCRSALAGEPPDDPLGGVALTAQDGRPFEAREYRGKTLVLSFFFTSCPTVCPKQTRVLRDAWRALRADVRERVEFVSVSVDPENDTPDALQRFAREHAAGLDFTFARASNESTRALAKRLAVFDTTRPGGDEPGGHTTAIYLFDARGRLMQRYGGGTEAPRLALEIQQIDSMNRSED